MNQIDTLLVAVIEDPHIGQEMDDQESADRDQARQRVQAADEEFVPAENRSDVSHFRLDAPSAEVYCVPQRTFSSMGLIGASPSKMTRITERILERN